MNGTFILIYFILVLLCTVSMCVCVCVCVCEAVCDANPFCVCFSGYICSSKLVPVSQYVGTVLVCLLGVACLRGETSTVIEALHTDSVSCFGLCCDMWWK